MSTHEPLNRASTSPRVLRQLCEALLCEGWAAEMQIHRDETVSWCLRQTHFRARGLRGAFGRYRLQGGSI
ncbi:hypothetical protein [Leisingera sp. MMG026]|uniref:hypothetical protein n=1 Tax=Leisingera sp. MMG026 TaxID=2909982 RepID=UPI001F47468D|nr:hypothetical protein [Leisingera sp. MMG026]MCF6429884.1 hypothetical protein [Leisingera sp. MMG026]